MSHHPLRALACVLSAVLVSAAVALPAGSATAAATPAASAWSIVPSPNTGTATTANLLDAVSCPIPGRCVAVGSYNTSDGARNLAESWNGTKWKLVPIPNPAGESDFLSGVSCSQGMCMAVGGDQTSAGGGSTRPLAERWNGHTWSIQPTPAGSGALSSLESVSCASSTFCMAVGSTGAEGNATLIESWNGTTWSVLPAHAGHAVASLLSVSCVSTSACVAVGSYGSSVKKTLAEHWNGTAWSVQSTPVVSPAGNDHALIGVSCVNATRCMAIGTTLTTSGALYLLAESLNHTKWTVVTTPATEENPYAVSCAGLSSCAATGSNATGQSLVLHWNGTAWNVVSNPHHPSTQSELDDVSCLAAGCIAVGNYHGSDDVNRTLTESNYASAGRSS